MKILSDLSRNSRNAIVVEPMWAVFGGLIFFYVPLYMKELGMTEVEMGIINTLNLLFSFVFHFLAGPVTNRMGRKKATLVFDTISWSIPMLIWAVAQNFWYFIIAAVINASVRIVTVSWYCLITEDTPENKRSKVFGIMYIINYASGIFTPITGFFIAKYGTISTMRVVYAAGMVSMTAMFILRNYIVTETKAGKEIMEKHSGLSVWQSLKSYISIISRIHKNKGIVLMAVIYILTNFILSINFFQVLFLKQQLGFNARDISITPGINALINVLLYIFIVPKLYKYAEEKLLTGALAIGALGSLLFLLIPRNNLSMLIITMAAAAIGSFLMQTYRDSVFMNRVGEHEKADIFAAVQTVTTLICIPSGYIAGYTYSLNPILPFIMILILFLAAMLISMALMRVKNKAFSQEE